MKKLLVVFVLMVGLVIPNLKAQNVLDGIYVKEHNPTRQVIPYAYLREADVMWAKRVWEVIDLKQKIRVINMTNLMNKGKLFLCIYNTL